MTPAIDGALLALDERPLDTVRIKVRRAESTPPEETPAEPDSPKS